MRQWFALKCVAVLGVLGLLAACAQSPQILSVQPKVSGGFPHTGSGQTVTLNVVDGRDDNVIGTRSGTASATSTITVEAHDVIPKLQAQAENALRSMGFNPTTQDTGGPSLTLTLAELDYARGNADEPLLGASQLQAIIAAKVENGSNTYTGRYTAKRKQSYAFKPDWDTNNRMVSELLSSALDRTFRDQQLANLLAR
ncbi:MULTISPECIES: YajG family lipoprotein [unclassified Salinicola]|uniref:YajG family lipoprotein n=1 Tax=unclassified Salinicola TaxID=2634022 RepID=UPI0004E765A2|nr:MULTISPECIES: YajG family lipoprotein [unclassified Salinicola]KFF50599.1 hypothetical protein GY26_00865 [Gammaproteobacteria bacterium MFB021]MCE3028923.1 YajG family lipoprotein [Salinicola sp. DM10]WIX34367.1 YajG family lipoprotein [Salinicola sp. JS01]